MLLFLFVTATSGAELVSGVVAIVNDEIITSHELEKEIATLKRDAQKTQLHLPEEPKELRKLALNTLIDKKLTNQRIKELDIKISEEEIRQSIEDVKKQNNLTQEALVAALLGQGVTFEQYREQLKEQLERVRLMGQEVKAKIQVSEKEIAAYYEANRAKYGEDDLYHARHIFFRVPKDASSADIKKIMTKALTVLQEARSGKDFVELAKANSDDPAAQKDGGDLGTFKKGDMLPEIEETVQRLQPGGISDLVSTPAGLHIIKLEEKLKNKVKPLSEVKGEIEETLFKSKSEERFKQWVKELRQSASIDIKE
jgi:peptidyl-prolyl cis-trans isomerase SurA